MMQLPSRWQVVLVLLPFFTCLLLWASFRIALAGLELFGLVGDPEKDMLWLAAVVASVSALFHGIARLLCWRSRFAPLVEAIAAGVSAALVLSYLTAQRGVEYGLLAIVAFAILFTGVAWALGGRARI